LVLDAVRALGRATANEVAERSGQPNGSVAVALRSLVARRLVARTETARGIEYTVVSPRRDAAP
jgi:DNA-binding IclR family transcriptional regulator